MGYIKKNKKIVCIDYADYDPSYGNNGGSYWFGDKFTKLKDGKWLHEEITSGEFCPYCGSWDCGGECHEPEIVTSLEVIEYVDRYAGVTDCDIRFCKMERK